MWEMIGTFSCLLIGLGAALRRAFDFACFRCSNTNREKGIREIPSAQVQIVRILAIPSGTISPNPHCLLNRLWFLFDCCVIIWGGKQVLSAVLGFVLFGYMCKFVWPRKEAFNRLALMEVVRRLLALHVSSKGAALFTVLLYGVNCGLFK